jgi:Tol biopolymer transport system component
MQRHDRPETFLFGKVDFNLKKAELHTSETRIKLRDRLPRLFWRPPEGHPNRWLPSLLLALLLVLLVWYFWRPSPAAVSQPRPKPVARQISFVGDAHHPSISPNGLFAAYSAGGQGPGHQPRVMVQDLTGGEPVVVFRGHDFIYSLRWSPNSSKLAISARNEAGQYGVYVVPRLGGEPRTLLPSLDSLCWSPDGARIAGLDHGSPKVLCFLNLFTPRRVDYQMEGAFDWIMNLDWSPAGDRLLFHTLESGKSTVWTFKPDEGHRKEAFSIEGEILSPRWSADGTAVYYLLATSQFEMWKTILSPGSDSQPQPAERLLAGIGMGRSFSVSHQQTRLLCTIESGYNNLWLATPSLKGGAGQMETKALTSDNSYYGLARISPDGKQIVFPRRDSETGIMNLYFMPVEGGLQRQITFSNHDTTSPAWSPDSKEVAFIQAGKVWKASLGAVTEFAASQCSYNPQLSWSPGPRIIYRKSGNHNFHVLDPANQKEVPLVKDGWTCWMFTACSSPDGSKVAVAWDRYPSGLWVISLKDSSETLLGNDWLEPVTWSLDGRSIYAVTTQENPQRILRLQAQGGHPIQTVWTLPRNASLCSMTSDGQRIIYSLPEGKSDVWLIENFDHNL